MEFISALAVSAGVGILSVIIALVQEILKKRQKGKEPNLQDRLASLTKSLESSVAVITEIEREISKRKDLALQLEQDAKRYSELKEINKAQVEAIAQTLSIQLKKESRKSFWLNFTTNLLIGLAFFFLGFFLGRR